MNLKQESFELICEHCGDICKDDSVQKDGKYFCCSGCLFVYELLNDNELDNYYKLAEKSGIKPIIFDKNEFSFLDNPDVKEKLLNFSIAGTSKVTLFTPEIYCTACLWLLENLFRLNKGIIESSVNLLSREIAITFREDKITLRGVVELLTSLGYRPKLSIADMEGKKNINPNKSLYFKVGVAGFVFGNVMLFAFPEYLSDGALEPDLKRYFSYLSLLLSGGAIYAASDYFKSAWASLKLKYINIDVPICIGILAILLRSYYDIFTGTGPGYIDSLSGLVFLLLTGRVFRQKTFHTLSFDRDYKSYFPLSVIRKSAGKEEYISLNEVKPGDKLIIRNNEIIPTDSLLLSPSAFIDYSFVTGESKPVAVSQGEKVFAGGIHKGSSIEITAAKVFKQSYITELWNHKAFAKHESGQTSKISDTAAKYFTFIVLSIGIACLAYWLPIDQKTALDAFTSVLIIACPCAFSLALPFAYGSAIRILSRNGLFLKNDSVVERMSGITAIVFDKTGTLTDNSKSRMEYTGKELNDETAAFVKSAAKHSTHPLSRLVYQYLKEYDELLLSGFVETPGQGIEAAINNKTLKLGKFDFVTNINTMSNQPDFKSIPSQSESSVFLAIDNELLGFFTLKPAYRENISNTLTKLVKTFKLAVLSGDNSFDSDKISVMTGGKADLEFNKLPVEKLNYIEKLQDKNHNVMMVGDGLNDSGALKQSDVGIAVTDSDSNFTPGSDGILFGDNIRLIPEFIELAKKSVRTVYLSFAVSVIYNIVGLFFAVQGLVTPLFAAVLMPLSSISIMAFSVLTVKYYAKRIGILHNI